MAEDATSTTCGVDHVGLSVRGLESSRRFFCDCLGWRVVGERAEYPAVFVSDSQLIVTLWRVEAPDQAVAFDRRTNVGLHHLALAVADRAGLMRVRTRCQSSWRRWGICPELSGKGPKIHFYRARAERDLDGVRLRPARWRVGGLLPANVQIFIPAKSLEGSTISPVDISSAAHRRSRSRRPWCRMNRDRPRP